MKKKQLKNFSHSNSNKRKQRKQAKNARLQAFNEKSFSSSTDFQHFTQKKHEHSAYRNPTAAQIAPFFTGEDDPPPVQSQYTYRKGEAQKNYLYDFTDSKFISFLGNLKPKSYLVFITLIALLITEDLNETETKIICAFILNTADTMLTLVEQEVILNSYKQKKEARELGNALHHDLQTIYDELDQLKKKLSPN